MLAVFARRKTVKHLQKSYKDWKFILEAWQAKMMRDRGKKKNNLQSFADVKISETYTKPHS